MNSLAAIKGLETCQVELYLEHTVLIKFLSIFMTHANLLDACMDCRAVNLHAVLNRSSLFIDVL